MDPVIAGAGVSAIGGLLQALMQQHAQTEAAARAERLAKEEAARQRLAQAEHDKLGVIQGMGQGEQGALGNLIASLQRTAR